MFIISKKITNIKYNGKNANSTFQFDPQHSLILLMITNLGPFTLTLKQYLNLQLERNLVIFTPQSGNAIIQKHLASTKHLMNKIMPHHHFFVNY